MGCDVKVGNKVKLSVQVECPDATLVYIRAHIFDANENQLSTRDMIDTGDGSFENFSYTMPNVDILKVKYLAYEDATYTTQIDDPCPGSDVFGKLEETGGGADSAVAGVQAVGKIVSGTIIGKVLGQKTLKGRVNNTTIKGQVQGSFLLKGKILNSTIIGRLICKK